MQDGALDRRIAAVRRFNRFYTQKIGVLREGLLDSPFSLAEGRVLYELAQRDEVTAAALCRELGLDPGYVSRILRGFHRRELIARRPSPRDGRQALVSLSEAGRAAFAPLDAASRAEIGALLGELPQSDQIRLVAAMRQISRALGNADERAATFVLRPHRPGDLSWIVWRHGVLYSEEFGWDEHFEGFVAAIAAGFIENFDPACERCWIAERDGENVGSVALVRESDSAGRLRLLLVEPQARGSGLGGRLVEEFLRFARQVRYERVVLSTYSVLVAARRLYEVAGFRLVAEHVEHRFGRDLVGEEWELRL
jgi:DNA-binding MarR family transcriptional regulator/RimJ/RimL family protein N-acetyltransferase